jgi:hyperosmotically inducible periplasmic protein
MKLLAQKAAQTLVLTGLFGLWTTGTFAQQPAPDNTKMNQADRSNDRPTADQQKDNPSDRELTQHVRQAIMEDKSLSTYAHNVKIISQNGVVTLKGPVRSDDERRAIEAKANEVAGKDKVVNELTVVPDQK